MNKFATYLQWRTAPTIALEVYYFDELMEKGAESPVLSELAKLWQIKPGKMFGAIPNYPGPLSSMLVGGMAGAGLGYGAGYLGEKLLPERWERGKLRRTLAMLGGGLGAAPGAAYMGLNAMSGHPLNHAGIGAGYKPPPRPDIWQPPEIPDMGPDAPFWGGRAGKQVQASVKEAFNTGAAYIPAIDVNEMNQVVWGDPRVARRLDPPMQAAATGLVTGAAHLPGRHQTKFVTPMDIGRMAAGMGSGYVSGLLVGKALGTMMGMPKDTQDTLKQTGMWAGVLANIVPKAFGG